MSQTSLSSSNRVLGLRIAMYLFMPMTHRLQRREVTYQGGTIVQWGTSRGLVSISGLLGPLQSRPIKNSYGFEEKANRIGFDSCASVSNTILPIFALPSFFRTLMCPEKRREEFVGQLRKKVGCGNDRKWKRESKNGREARAGGYARYEGLL